MSTTATISISRRRLALLVTGGLIVAAVSGAVGTTAQGFRAARNGVARLERQFKQQLNLAVSSIDQKISQVREQVVPSSELNACQLRTYHRSNSSVPFQPVLLRFWNSTAAADLCPKPAEPSFWSEWLPTYFPPPDPLTPKSSDETISALTKWFWTDYVPNVYLMSVYDRLYDWMTNDVFPRLQKWNTTTTVTTTLDDLPTFNSLFNSTKELLGKLLDYTTIPVDGEPHGAPKAPPPSFQDMHTAWQRSVSIVFVHGRFTWPSVAMSQNPLRTISWVWRQTASASCCAPTSSRITERAKEILQGMEGICRRVVLCLRHLTVEVVGGTATSAITSVREFVGSITDCIIGFLASPIQLWRTVFGDDAASDQPPNQPPNEGTFLLLPGCWRVIRAFATNVWWLLSSASQVIFGSAGLAVAVLFMFPFLVLGFFLLRWFFQASIRNITGFVHICFRVTVIFILFIGWLCLPQAWKASIGPLMPLLLVSGAAGFFWIRGSMDGDMRNDVYNMLRRESHRKYDSVQLRNDIVGRKYRNALVHWFAKAWAWPVIQRDVQADHRVKKSREGIFVTTEKWQWDRSAQPSGTVWRLIKRLRGRYEWEQPMAGN
jgi:hypothetical protein